MFRTRKVNVDNCEFGSPEPGTVITHALPARPAKQGMRNLTGLYLGVECDRPLHSQTKVILGRGRGMPSQRIQTPTELRRYSKVYSKRSETPGPYHVLVLSSSKFPTHYPSAQSKLRGYSCRKRTPASCLPVYCYHCEVYSSSAPPPNHPCAQPPLPRFESQPYNPNMYRSAMFHPVDQSTRLRSAPQPCLPIYPEPNPNTQPTTHDNPKISKANGYVANASGVGYEKTNTGTCVAAEMLPNSANISLLPCMPASRYPLLSPQHKVELLRTREAQRGFSGNPLKRRQRVAATELDQPYLQQQQQHQQAFQQPPPLTIWDLTRQTKRCFTAANNNGVTHLEYLRPDPNGAVSAFYPSAFSEPEPNPEDAAMYETVSNEIRRAAELADHRQQTAEDMSALVDCYRKICRNNQDTLNTLLPLRRTPHFEHQADRIPAQFSPTGFCVKSYRKPQNAEILAHFPEPPPPRPRTVGRTYTRGPNSPPSPFFFKTYNAPGSVGDQRRLPRSYTPFPDEPLIVGKPGCAVPHRTTNTPTPFSKPGSAVSLRGRGSHHSAHRRPIGTVNISIPNSGGDTDWSERHEQAAEEADQEKEANETVTQGKLPQEGDTVARTQRVAGESAASETGANTAADMMDLVTNPGGSKLQKTPSGTEIVIGLENEIGERTPVDIDDTDDQLEVEEVASNGSVRRRVSITDRILRSRNSMKQVAQMQQEAVNRKKQLEELLHEHAQIVHAVEVAMENGEEAVVNDTVAIETRGDQVVTTSGYEAEESAIAENKENVGGGPAPLEH